MPSEHFHGWAIHRGEAYGSGVRQVSDAEIVRWRRAVRAAEQTPAELAEADGWNPRTVRKYVYGSTRQTTAVDAREPPVKRSPFVGGSVPRQGRIEVDAGAVWRERHARTWTCWAHEMGHDPSAVASHMRARGWRRENVSVLTHAPCARCKRKEVPVADLSEDRVCPQCRSAEEAGTLSHEDLRREREAYLRRQRKAG